MVKDGRFSPAVQKYRLWGEDRTDDEACVSLFAKPLFDRKKRKVERYRANFLKDRVSKAFHATP